MRRRDLQANTATAKEEDERQTRVAGDVKEASMVRFRGPTRVKTALREPKFTALPDQLPRPRPNSRACLSSGRRVVRRRCGPKGCADGGVEDGGRKQGIESPSRPLYAREEGGAGPFANGRFNCAKHDQTTSFRWQGHSIGAQTLSFLFQSFSQKCTLDLHARRRVVCSEGGEESRRFFQSFCHSHRPSSRWQYPRSCLLLIMNTIAFRWPSLKKIKGQGYYLTILSRLLWQPECYRPQVLVKHDDNSRQKSSVPQRHPPLCWNQLVVMTRRNVESRLSHIPASGRRLRWERAGSLACVP